MPQGLTSSGTLLALLACCGLSASIPAHAQQADPRPATAIKDHNQGHEGLPNFDIRFTPEGTPTQRVLNAQARRAGSPGRQKAIDLLRQRIDQVRVDDDVVFGTARFVQSWRQFLTDAAPAASPIGVTRQFVIDYSALAEIAPAEVDHARVLRDYKTDHNGVQHLTLQQQIGGIDLFGAAIRANITKDRRLINFSSTMLPRPTHPPNPEGDFAPPAYEMSDEEAIIASVASVGVSLRSTLTPAEEPRGASRKREWNSPPELRAGRAVTTERVYFPVSREEIRPAWHVVIPTRGVGHTYEIVIDAVDGTVLHRRNQLCCDTTEPITMRVYPGRSPTPGAGNFTNSGFKYPFASRRPITVNPGDVALWSTNGWIDDGVTETLGNNVDCHLDRDANDIADLPRPNGGPSRIFDFPQDNSADPLTNGAATVVNAFYVANLYHDRLYTLGFNEVSGNFQANNFGRGGAQNDAVQLDCQDGAGTNNANFTTPADGTAGRCQMYIFTGPTPDRDTGLDGDMLIHELTHGTSNRLTGGLSSLQSRGMAEGWSDFFSICMASVPGEDPDGVYCFGGYVADQYYGGLRRYPYTTSMAKNPLTWDSYGTTGTANGVTRTTEVHNTGEIWCTTLWGCRAALHRTMGFVANEEMLQLVVDGLKLVPDNPTFGQARDAILAADLANNGGANAMALWTAFAKRGLGVSFATGSSSTALVIQAFDVPESGGGGDAGELPATAQAVTGSGELRAITGTLSTDNVDVYRVSICDLAAFSAATIGGASFDTQLFLFTTAGVPITFNDNASATTQSRLTNQFVPATGEYLLAISAADRDPISDTGEIWLDAPAGTERAPDGPGAMGGAGVLSGWTGSGDPGASAPYTIVLTGACASGVGSIPVGPKSLTAFGEPAPPSILFGDAAPVQFKIYVYKGTVPDSTGVTVSLNASSMGLGTLTLLDTGVVDSVYTAQATPGALAAGSYTLPYTVTDAQGRTYNDTTLFTVIDSPGACCVPSGACVFVGRALCLGQSGVYVAIGLPCDIQPCTARPEVEPNGTTGSATNGHLYRPYTGSLFHNGIDGAISASTDADYFAIGALQPGDVITVTQSGDDSGVGSLPNARVRLYRNGSANPVADDDDSGPGQDSLIFKFPVVTADTYFVRADGSAAADVGTYKVGLFVQNSGTAPSTGEPFTAEVEPNETKGAASDDATSAWRQIQYISTTVGTITTGDSDFYKFSFNAGDVISTNVLSLGDLDARVNLRNAAGTTIFSESGESAGPGGDSPIFGYVVPNTGDYYLEVAAAGGTGPYYSVVYLSTNFPPPQPPPACRPDFNGNGLDIQDVFDFLNAWFSNDLRADFNGGGLAISDVFDFLNAWFAGCP